MPERARRKPSKRTHPAPAVQDFRSLLNIALKAKDDQGRQWSAARWGCYAFYDYDGEPIYVGQTNERLSVRVRRHLTNQRTDAAAMRILDVFEVAEMELWPLWELEKVTNKSPDHFKSAQATLNATEYTAYARCIKASRFKAILNEKIPPVTSAVELPPSRRFQLISDEVLAERGHPDTRIARRAENLSRLAAVAHERGEVSGGLRRVLVIQAVRLAYLSAVRYAEVEGLPQPSSDAIDVSGLVGSTYFDQTHDSEIPYDDADS